MKVAESPNEEDETISVGVRVPAAMAAEMKRLAKTEDTSLSQVLKWAVGAFVLYYETTGGKILNAEAMRRLMAEKIREVALDRPNREEFNADDLMP